MKIYMTEGKNTLKGEERNFPWKPEKSIFNTNKSATVDFGECYNECHFPDLSRLDLRTFMCAPEWG